MPDRADERRANLERAETSLRAAQELLANDFFDFSVSRAYYAAFYAASALLLKEGLETRKHSGVIALVHQHFVKTNKLTAEQGKNLNWLFELRNIGDYGGVIHLAADEAQQAIEVANEFLEACYELLKE